jgi:hypothetical protein
VEARESSGSSYKDADGHDGQRARVLVESCTDEIGKPSGVLVHDKACRNQSEHGYDSSVLKRWERDGVSWANAGV